MRIRFPISARRQDDCVATDNERRSNRLWCSKKGRPPLPSNSAFLDNVEDDPKGAAKVFAEAVETARHLLLEGLLGQAKALRQLNKKDELLHCLEQIIHLARFERRHRAAKSETSAGDKGKALPKNGLQFAVQFKGPHAAEIEELLGNLITSEARFAVN